MARLAYVKNIPYLCRSYNKQLIINIMTLIWAVLVYVAIVKSINS